MHLDTEMCELFAPTRNSSKIFAKSPSAWLVSSEDNCYLLLVAVPVFASILTA